MVENRAADREVLTEVQGAVLVITLNRPEAKNAATAAMAEQMAADAAATEKADV